MDEKPKEEPKVDKPVVKSWDQLKKEAKTQAKEKLAKKLKLDVKEEKKDEPTDTKLPEREPEPTEDKPTVEEKKPEEPKIDVDAIARRAGEEAAAKVAEAAKADKAEFQAKLDELLNKETDMQQKQKDADDLISVWDKEGRLPKDYKELISETQRITEAKWAQQARAAEAAKPKEEPKVDAPTTSATPTVEDYQKRVSDELNTLYSTGTLPKPTDFNEINNPNTTDNAAKMTQKVLEFGVKLNTSIVKTGGQPITSVIQMHHLYKLSGQDKVDSAPKQPAGGDAPVSPSRNQSTTQQDAPKPFYQKGEDGRYHPKSWAQIKFEQAKARLGR